MGQIRRGRRRRHQQVRPRAMGWKVGEGTRGAWRFFSRARRCARNLEPFVGCNAESPRTLSFGLRAAMLSNALAV